MEEGKNVIQYKRRNSKNINKAAGTTLLALARVLGCEVEDLLEYKNNDELPARYTYIYSVSGVIGIMGEWIDSGFAISSKKLAKMVLQMCVKVCMELEKAGVYHEYQLYGKGQIEIGHVFHCNIRLEEAKKYNKAECEFFKKFI